MTRKQIFEERGSSFEGTSKLVIGRHEANDRKYNRK